MLKVFLFLVEDWLYGVTLYLVSILFFSYSKRALVYGNDSYLYSSCMILTLTFSVLRLMKIFSVILSTRKLMTFSSAGYLVWFFIETSIIFLNLSYFPYLSSGVTYWCFCKCFNLAYEIVWIMGSTSFCIPLSLLCTSLRKIVIPSSTFSSSRYMISISELVYWETLLSSSVSSSLAFRLRFLFSVWSFIFKPNFLSRLI